jgi:aminoglycoside phosphotransferase (APT) family kinase protein
MTPSTSGTVAPAPPTAASPSWWGADSDRHRLLPGHDRPDGAFVKVMRPATAAYVHLRTAFSAARAAGEARLGPRVLEASTDTATLVLEDRTATAKTATLDDLQNPDHRSRHLALRRQVMSLDVPDARRATVFDDVRTLHQLSIDVVAPLPADLPWMLRLLDDAELRIAAVGADSAFCHGDGNVSNVMLAPDGRQDLLDWDVAAMMDPLQDLGAVLAEIAGSEQEAREIFEQAWGSFDLALFARARVYGVADGVRWGLLGGYVGAVDPGTHEYSKFSDWQFLRARWALAAPTFDDHLRAVTGSSS